MRAGSSIARFATKRLLVLSCRPALKHLTFLWMPWSCLVFVRCRNLTAFQQDNPAAHTRGLDHCEHSKVCPVWQHLRHRSPFFLSSLLLRTRMAQENISIRFLTLDAGLDGVVMAPGLSLRISFSKLASTSINVNIEDVFHRVANVLRTNPSHTLLSKFPVSLSPLLNPLPRLKFQICSPLCSDKVGWNSHRSFTLEQFQNLRNLHFPCEMEWDEGPDPFESSNHLAQHGVDNGNSTVQPPSRYCASYATLPRLWMPKC